MNSGGRREAAGLCAKGCGFYGSEATLGFCSNCYRLHLLSTQANAPPKNQALEGGNGGGVSGCSSGAQSPDFAPEMKKLMKPRCATCRRKVGLAMATISCRCGGGVFCSEHLLPEKHGCTYDYRSTGRLLLAAANPLIKAAKLEKMESTSDE